MNGVKGKRGDEKTRLQYNITKSHKIGVFVIQYGEKYIIRFEKRISLKDTTIRYPGGIMIDEKKLESIKNRIVEAVSPEKIILFGSYASGESTEDSDIDIVVIWDTDLNPHKRNLFLSRLFLKRNFSLDIFAFTKKEAEKLKEVAGTILYEAFHHGKVIYG